MTATLKVWAEALGCHADTLRKRLRRAGYDVTTTRRWAAHEVFEAWTSDKVAATTREANARAEKLEYENRAARRQLVPSEDVRRFIEQSYVPVREQVLAMPSVMAGKVNPTDPQHAHQHLREWADGMLAHCRMHLPEPPDEG